METSNLREFLYAELKVATGNFKSGMSGRMFKGWVPENTLAPSAVGIGMAVAVKRFDPGNTEDVEQWEIEMLLGKLSHANVVKLLGYCRENSKKKLFLVYEFVSNGSLPNHLFRKFLRNEPLSWDSRLSIAIGAARGLSCLHSSNIIHRDVKPATILLDGGNNTKISNFHFAMSGPANGGCMPASVYGTVGYVDPEYVITGKLSAKSDVYSFGVVLLQILTGLMACDYTHPQERISLVEWAIPFLSHETKLQTIMDAQMEDLYSSQKGASDTAQLALRCLERNPEKRPPMIEVVVELERILANRTTTQ